MAEKTMVKGPQLSPHLSMLAADQAFAGLKYGKRVG
jgi:hypothetical protein